MFGVKHVTNGAHRKSLQLMSLRQIVLYGLHQLYIPEQHVSRPQRLLPLEVFEVPTYSVIPMLGLREFRRFLVLV